MSRKFKTLEEARKYASGTGWTIYCLKGAKVWKYFVGTHIQWLNLR